MQGQLDTELTDLGRRQAEDVAQVLVNRHPLLIISSDLRRAHDTATMLAARTGQEVHCDARLREMHLGDWQGLTEPDIDASAPGSRLRWQADPTWAGHGGESRVDVAARATALLDELVTDHEGWGLVEPERAVVLVAHNAVLAALTAGLLGLPVENSPALGGMGNASWTQLSGHATDAASIRWRLDIWNASGGVAKDVL